MKNGKCFIFGAGEFFGADITTGENDLVIAADGGLKHLEGIGISPDIIIGDFDSSEHIPQGEYVFRLPTEKDVTDTFAAVQAGLEKGYTDFYIFGGTGGREAHTMANIQTLLHICNNGGRAYLFGKNEIFTVTKSEMHFSPDFTGYVSVFAMGKANGVTETGLKYSLNDASLSNDYPLGVSNEFCGRESCVSVRAGTLLLVFGRENEKYILSK